MNLVQSLRVVEADYPDAAILFWNRAIRIADPGSVHENAGEHKGTGLSQMRPHHTDRFTQNSDKLLHKFGHKFADIPELETDLTEAPLRFKSVLPNVGRRAALRACYGRGTLGRIPVADHIIKLLFNILSADRAQRRLQSALKIGENALALVLFHSKATGEQVTVIFVRNMTGA